METERPKSFRRTLNQDYGEIWKLATWKCRAEILHPFRVSVRFSGWCCCLWTLRRCCGLPATAGGPPASAILWKSKKETVSDMYSICMRSGYYKWRVGKGWYWSQIQNVAGETLANSVVGMAHTSWSRQGGWPRAECRYRKATEKHITY